MVVDFVNDVDIKSIIEEGSVETWFQPIVSLRRQRILAVEALSRGRDLTDGSIISPYVLFSEASKAGLTHELDALCLKKAVETYRKLREQMVEVMLSLNVTCESITGMENLEYLGNYIEELGLDASRVILEVLEQSVLDEKIISEFVDCYHDRNYIIGLDDIGSAHSSLLRMAHCKPDVIKIDRGLINGISGDVFKREVVRALTVLAHKLGILVVAEGVETRDDLLDCMDIGIDLYQGYYFAKPFPMDDFHLLDCENVIRKAVDTFRDKCIGHWRSVRSSRELYEKRFYDIKRELQRAEFRNLEDTMRDVVKRDKDIEYIYAIDEDGTQVTGSVARFDKATSRRSYIFRPSRMGESMSMKSYFMALQTGLDEFTSKPYISSASGMSCITHSCRFQTSDGMKIILCIDLLCQLD